MVQQHIYRWSAEGGYTVAVSSELRRSAWLRLLEQQLPLYGPLGLQVPVYFRYPFGRGVAISRCGPDLINGRGYSLIHQLIVDDPIDLETLSKASPLPKNLFRSMFPDKYPMPWELPALSLTSSDQDAELKLCQQTLLSCFSGMETLLTRFLRSLSLVARDKRYSIFVILRGDAFSISETGRRLMEFVLRYLPREDGLRLSYCTLWPQNAGAQWSVCFLPEEQANLVDPGDPQTIYLDLVEGRLSLPRAVMLPEEAPYAALARAMLLQGNPADVSAMEDRGTPSAEPVLKMDVPRFEKGMSLKQYFDDWCQELELRRASLTEEGFQIFAESEYPMLLSNMVVASEVMDNLDFLTELCDILNVILREQLAQPLDLPEETLNDMIALMLEGIKWRQIDLCDLYTVRLLRNITAYSTLIPEEEDNFACMAAARAVYRLLSGTGTFQESLMDLSELEKRFPTRFQEVQDCLKRYVEGRVSAEMDIIDDTLVVAAMLGYARFADGVPDLRLLDKLSERIAEIQGPKEARKFLDLWDKQRRKLHSAPTPRRRDIRITLTICLVLLLLIAAITVGYLLWH